MAGTSIYLVDTVDLSKIELQFVPTEMSFMSDSKIEAVVSPGRNNPFYHFSGSEDSLKFQIDWHAMEQSREDVIRKCRWLKSLTKADGYKGGQRKIQLIWGSMIKGDSLWIVKSANFQVSLFDKVNGIFPRQAYQDIILMKVTSYNRSIDDVRNGLDTQTSKTGL